MKGNEFMRTTRTRNIIAVAPEGRQFQSRRCAGESVEGCGRTSNAAPANSVDIKEYRRVYSGKHLNNFGKGKHNGQHNEKHFKMDISNRDGSDFVRLRA